MTKLGKAWSWLAAKTRSSGSSQKSGPPYREIPPIPVPKARGKARYSLVLIGESGSSRQIELTRFRIRVAVAAAVLVVGFVLAMGLGGASFLSGRSQGSDKDDALAEKVKSLQDELRKKDLALAIQEKRLKEMQESPTLATVPPRPTMEAGSLKAGASGQDSEAQDDGALTSIEDSVKLPAGLSTRARTREGETEGPTGSFPRAAGRKRSAALGSIEREITLPAASSEGAATTPMINFNAQDVTANAEGPNTGTLSFRLVKDQPDIKFSGYLFVFVEMADQRGENKIYAYPKSTRLGDEDLPLDYKDGENLSFKYNSRVELPYGDIRLGASLTRVSILLYGDNGKIVFQRGFDREELKVVNAKPTNVEGGRSKPGDKRRAL